MSVEVAAALSEHPLATHAAGECIGHLLERLGGPPDVVLVTVGPPLLGALEDIGGAAGELLGPDVLLGCGAAAALGGAHLVEGRSAVGILGVRMSPSDGGARAVRLVAGPDGAVDGLDDLAGATGTLLMLADTTTLPLGRIAADVGVVAPGLRVVGGGASGAAYPGGNRLLLGGEVYSDGAVGVVLPPGLALDVVVSHAAGPVGPVLTVTDSLDGAVVTLDHRPAADVVDDVLAGAVPGGSDRAGDLYLGRWVDGPDGPEVLVEPVRHRDAATGALRVDGAMAEGDRVQLHVVDPVAASAAVGDRVGDALSGRRPAGALVLTCTGRGARLLDATDADAVQVDDAVGGAPLGGLACHGQLVPSAGRTVAVSQTAVVVLLG